MNNQEKPRNYDKNHLTKSPMKTYNRRRKTIKCKYSTHREKNMDMGREARDDYDKVNRFHAKKFFTYDGRELYHFVYHDNKQKGN